MKNSKIIFTNGNSSTNHPKIIIMFLLLQGIKSTTIVGQYGKKGRNEGNYYYLKEVEIKNENWLTERTLTLSLTEKKLFLLHQNFTFY